MITDTTMETKVSPPDRFKVIFPESSGSGWKRQPQASKNTDHQRRRVRCGHSVKGGEATPSCFLEATLENSSYSPSKALI